MPLCDELQNCLLLNMPSYRACMAYSWGIKHGSLIQLALKAGSALYLCELVDFLPGQIKTIQQW